MTQNDEALYQDGSHRVYNPMLSNYTYLMLYTFFCRLQISKGIASLRRIAIALPCFLACNSAVVGDVVIIACHCNISRQLSFILPFVNRSNDDR